MGHQLTAMHTKPCTRACLSLRLLPVWVLLVVDTEGRITRRGWSAVAGLFSGSIAPACMGRVQEGGSACPHCACCAARFPLCSWLSGGGWSAVACLSLFLLVPFSFYLESDGKGSSAFRSGLRILGLALPLSGVVGRCAHTPSQQGRLPGEAAAEFLCGKCHQLFRSRPL